ncbi:hypothetical protein VTN77DRAFT_329 [Rasamsonia byssochlamydoides]|uniref:uncharacterized protein n=1 Tax=Rasamsonia byssochlamydoides TaxID=89139 RepID=UPI00085CF2CA
MFGFTSSWSAALAVCILSLLATSQAHTVMTTLFVDGVNQGDGVCIRMNNNGSTSNFFVSPVSSKDIACGMEGEIGAARVCPAKSSSILTFEFREHPENVSSPPLDPSHKGPAAVYLKKVDSATASNNAAGDGWFKIWESVYDETSDKWGTTKMIENNGHISVQVPEDIEGGYYLARTELLALHAASANPPDPQFFVGCVQLFIESNGTAKPSTVRIGEGTYNLSMPGLTYNIWEKPLSLPYPTFGPTVYKAGTAPAAGTSTASAVSSSATTTVTPLPTASVPSSQQNVGECAVVIAEEIEKRAAPLVQTEGLKPEGCIFVNGNWCGFEVPSYTDQNSCWASSNNCWAQSDDCWNKTQPTGYNLCPIWQAKCREISNGCQNGNWTGPPHQGQDITPPWPSLTGSLEIFN